MPERTTASSVALSKLDDPLSLASRLTEVSELAQAARGFACERTFIEAADPWRRRLGGRDCERPLSLGKELRAVLSPPEGGKPACAWREPRLKLGLPWATRQGVSAAPGELDSVRRLVEVVRKVAHAGEDVHA